MYKYLKVIAIMVAAMFLLGAGSETMFVQNKAKIMASPSFKGKVVTVARKGTEVEVLSKEGRWYEVKVEGKIGWVSRLLVSKTPPMGKVSVLSDSGDRKISKTARRRASVMTSAAAARGLAEDDRRRAGAETMSDYAALERMESVNVTEDQVDNFIEGLAE